MAIPTNIKTAVKSLLFIDSTDTDRDTFLQDIYEGILHGIIQMRDWMVASEDINSVAGQSIYSVNTDNVRILAIYYAGTCLRKSRADAQDLLDPTWQTVASGNTLAPEVWWVDQIPPSLDSLGSITPEHFVLFPTPNASTNSNIRVQKIAMPASDDPSVAWIDPLLIYRTTADMLRNNVEEREPDVKVGQNAAAAAKFFDTLADIWEKALDSRIVS